MANYNAKAPLHTRWKPGQSGNPNGRPKAQDHLKADFIQALRESFEKFGAKAIADVIRKKPEEYLKVIAKVLPKELDVTHHKGMPDEERQDMVAWLVKQLQQADPQEPKVDDNGTAH